MWSLAPSLLHHPGMMKPRERLGRGCGAGSEGVPRGAGLSPLLPTQPTGPCSIWDPRSLIHKNKDNFKGTSPPPDGEQDGHLQVEAGREAPGTCTFHALRI